MNMNKIIKSISLLFCVFSLISMKAQNDSRVAQIPEIVDLYEQLERMFPYSDYVNLTQTEVSYWVNNNMKQTEDFAQGLKKMQSAIKKIKAIYGDDNIVVESTNSDDSLVFACRPNYHDSVQSNYMEIVYNREKIHFYYGSSLNDKSANYHEANDNIVADIDNMLKTFMMRSGVTKDSIVFDGPSYKYQLVTFTNFQQMMQHAEGVVYNIPNAKHSDWLQFFNKMKSYAIKANVRVAWNDVYREYESVAIWVDRENTIPVVFAAAMKGDTLKVLRLEGTKEYNIILPRVWSEESPVFSPKRIKAYTNLN